MIHTTRWRPDTCDCVLEYTWDDEVPAEQRTHNLSTYVNTCNFHHLANEEEPPEATDEEKQKVKETLEQKYNTVKEENQRKNITLLEALTNGPAALSDINQDGSRQLKGNLSYNFAWSGTAPDRVLTINFSGITLTTPQRNAIQTFLNNKFGVGKVVIA